VHATGTGLVVVFMSAGGAVGQDVRQHTRLAGPKGTTLTESQAAALTLTLSSVSPRLIQTWVRTAGTIDKTGRILGASLSGPEATLVKVGQRVRAFPPSSKSSMYQAYITRVVPRDDGAAIEASLTASGRQNTTHYVMEIVVERGPFLSVPNEAIIEEGDRHIVYIQHQPGQYVPVEIQTGIQGELLTQVLDGVTEDAQVVTFGSFFIDAEHKLKGTEQGPSGTAPDDHQRH
jgi:Cu(I)/Ag(I) efflux system membrane fusion protein